MLKLNSNRTQKQLEVELETTNGLGFDKLNYIPEDSRYKNYLTEEEVKNTNSGLHYHLARMNLDRDLNEYNRLKKKWFFGEVKAKKFYEDLMNDYKELNNLAIKEAVSNKGGLFSVVVQHGLLNKTATRSFLFDPDD